MSQLPINEQNTEPSTTKRSITGVMIIYAGILALLGLLGWGLIKAQAGPRESGVAPDFTLTGFDGRTVQLSNLRGQVVIINFWASWCLPCREEAAYLEETWRKYKDEGVVFIGVDYVDTEKEALAYIQEFDITYINGPDIGTRIAQVLADIGLIGLVIAFIFSLYATCASVYGGWRGRSHWVESARNASLLVFPLLTIPVLAIVYSLYTFDFSLAYVYDVSSHAMSPFLRVTALWGGQQGSVLFWAWLMAAFVGIVLLRKWDRDRELMPYVIFVAMLTTTFFIGLVLFITNPFARLWYVPGATELTQAIFQPANAMPYFPDDGNGLNPLLRHFGMIGHPPTTYLGFTGFVIPFAFAMAALITGQSRRDEWILTTRRWTLFAWIFLSIGLLLGGRWAYDVLGWGGFWGWDPIENAMLMPWLTGTAFLHSVMMTEKRGMMKK